MMAPPSQSDDGRTGAQLAEHTEPAAEQVHGRRGLIRSPYLQGLIALAVYAIPWLALVTRPLIVHAARAQLDQKSMDPNFYVWCLRWWPWAIQHGANPLFTHVIGAPTGFSLAWVTTIPPLALAAAPVTLFAGPVVSFNLLAAIAIPLTAWAAFVLCRRLTGAFWPALVGGLVYGFSAYEMNHGAAGQLNLTFSMLLPLMVYIVVLWRDQSISSRTCVILLAVAMALQLYLFLETFADMTGIVAIALVLGYLLAGRDNRPQVLRMGLHIGAAYVLSLILAAPYLLYALSNKAPKLIHVTGLDLASLIILRKQRTYHLHWLAHLARQPVEASAAGYVGIPLLIVIVALAVTTWSSRLTRFLTWMVGIIVVASMGWEVTIDGHQVATLPWKPLWKLPLVRNAFPSRLMLFAFLVLAVIATLWLARTSAKQWQQWGRWGMGALIVFAVIIDIPPFGYSKQSNVPAYIASGAYKKDLTPGESVAVVSTVGNAGMLWQANTDFYMKLAGGYINQAITRRTDLPWQIQNLSGGTPLAVDEFEAYVRNTGLGAVLLDESHVPVWVGIFGKMGLRSELVGGVRVIPTDGCRTCKVLTAAQLKTYPPAR